MVAVGVDIQATIQPYEKSPLPAWVPLLCFSLVIVTVLIPQISRKRQLAKNKD
jgi:hypothetical protein